MCTQVRPKKAPVKQEFRPLTQEELLAEAAQTEIENTVSVQVARWPSPSQLCCQNDLQDDHLIFYAGPALEPLLPTDIIFSILYCVMRTSWLQNAKMIKKMTDLQVGLLIRLPEDISNGVANQRPP